MDSHPILPPCSIKITQAEMTKILIEKMKENQSRYKNSTQKHVPLGSRLYYEDSPPTTTGRVDTPQRLSKSHEKDESLQDTWRYEDDTTRQEKSQDPTDDWDLSSVESLKLTEDDMRRIYCRDFK
jgi:hypothetical protein